MLSKASWSIGIFTVLRPVKAVAFILWFSAGAGLAQDKELKIAETFIEAMAISPDGKYLAVSSHQINPRVPEIVVFDLEQEKPIKSLQSFRSSGACGRMVFSKDGKRLNSLMPGMVVIWDLQTGKEQSSHVISGEGQMITEDFLVMVQNRERSVVSVVELKTGKHTPIKGFDTNVELASVSSDGKHVATIQRDGPFKVWEVSSGKVVLSKDHKHVKRIFFVDKDNAVAVVTPKLAIYDLKTGKKSGPYYFPTDVFSSDGKMMACISRMWNIPEDEKKPAEDYAYGLHMFSRVKNHVIASIPVAANSHTPHILFSPDDRFLYAATAKGSVRCWNISNIKP